MHHGSHLSAIQGAKVHASGTTVDRVEPLACFTNYFGKKKVMFNKQAQQISPYGPIAHLKSQSFHTHLLVCKQFVKARRGGQ